MADPSTTPVSPFNPAAVQVPRDGPGCSKPLLIGCGLLVLLLGAGVVAIRIEAPAIFRWTFRVAETGLMPRLPADATPAERQRLHQAFEAAGRSIGSDQADLGNLQRVQREIMTLSGSQAALTHQQVRELTEALETLAHKPAAPGPSPAPVPGTPPLHPGAAPSPGAPGPGQAPPSGAVLRQPAATGPVALLAAPAGPIPGAPPTR